MQEVPNNPTEYIEYHFKNLELIQQLLRGSGFYQNMGNTFDMVTSSGIVEETQISVSNMTNIPLENLKLLLTPKYTHLENDIYESVEVIFESFARGEISYIQYVFFRDAFVPSFRMNPDQYNLPLYTSSPISRAFIDIEASSDEWCGCFSTDQINELALALHDPLSCISDLGIGTFIKSLHSHFLGSLEPRITFDQFRRLELQIGSFLLHHSFNYSENEINDSDMRRRIFYNIVFIHDIVNSLSELSRKLEFGSEEMFLKCTEMDTGIPGALIHDFPIPHDLRGTNFAQSQSALIRLMLTDIDSRSKRKILAFPFFSKKKERPIKKDALDMTRKLLDARMKRLIENEMVPYQSDQLLGVPSTIFSNS